MSGEGPAAADARPATPHPRDRETHPRDDVSGETLARVIWSTSRRDEGTISATGADIIAAALIASGAVRPAAEVRAEALREARDALYRGEGPDMFEDSDLVYGEWLGNRADRVALVEEGGR